MPAAVALNEAVEAPPATVNDAGTGSKVSVLVRFTEEPPEGATSERVTVQVVIPPAATEVGEQVRELIAGMVTVPPTDVMPSAVADESEATAFDRPTEVVVAVELSTPVKYAKTPDPTVLSFKPLNRQVDELVEFEQITDLPAAVAAGPAVIEALPISLDAYVIVHWREVGAVPDEARDMAILIELPGLAVSGARLIEVWAQRPAQLISPPITQMTPDK